MAPRAPQQPASPWSPSLWTTSPSFYAGADPGSLVDGSVGKPRRVWRTAGRAAERLPCTDSVCEKDVSAEKMDSLPAEIAKKREGPKRPQHRHKVRTQDKAGVELEAQTRCEERSLEDQTFGKAAAHVESLENLEEETQEEKESIKQRKAPGVDSPVAGPRCEVMIPEPGEVAERKDGGNSLETVSIAGDEEAMFMNTCYLCGETHILIADLGSDFTCEFMGIRCTGEETSRLCSKGQVEQPQMHRQEELAEEKRSEEQHVDVRTRCLLQAAQEKLTRFELAELLLAKGLDPSVGEDELATAIAQSKERSKKLAQQRSREKTQPATRYLDGQVVQLKNGQRFLQEDKESKEQKAMTSVSIRVLGSHTGASSAKEKKKGPRS